MQSNFEDSLAHVLVHEGGFSDHPQDPGGATNKGVTLAVFQRFFGSHLTKEDLRAISSAQLREIYTAGYWDKCRCDDLPAGVDYVVFDQAVNSGPGRSARWLQESVGAAVDGGIGPQTVAAALAHDAADAINGMCDVRLAFMKRIRDGELWATFGRGWQRRVDGVRRHGLAVAGGEPVPAPVAADAAPSVDYDVVRLGSRGPWVGKLQAVLGIEADGVFGPATDAALRAYQGAEGLVVDGVAGRGTYRAMGLVE